MEVIIVASPEEVARRGADVVCKVIRRKPNAVLGLATGGTPLALYRELIARNQRGEVSFRHVTTFNLDEYLGIKPTHPQSYRYYMNTNFFEHIDIDLRNTNLPNGVADNPHGVGPEYEERIHAVGGIDLQVLGLGRNGHIGFNEPSSSLRSRTRPKELTPTTIEDNSRFFKEGEFQPDTAITMGIGTIMDARRVLMLATGWQKAKAIVDMVEGGISAMVPASMLQMHSKVKVIVDDVAANQLTMIDYYKTMQASQEKLTKRYDDPRF